MENGDVKYLFLVGLFYMAKRGILAKVLGLDFGMYVDLENDIPCMPDIA